ncbi:D-alanyl-D-alanine carboxypeptidase [compost metagenome]
MYKNDWVLEEYLEYLRSEEHISVEVERKKYNISYYPASKKSMHIKVGQDYSISGDNVTGIIVTSR